MFDLIQSDDLALRRAVSALALAPASPAAHTPIPYQFWIARPSILAGAALGRQ